jgi:type IV pilus assembly protein PilY1
VAVFQAANDGMLHVFNGRVEDTETSRGEEIWAYVPGLVHGKLADRAAVSGFQHEYLVDSTPATAVISTSTTTGTVSRILVGGLGKGGAGYYALDITSGTANAESDVVSKVLWEFKPTNMGYSFGTPMIVRTADGWKVVVTSGYRNDTGTNGLGGDGLGHVWVLNPLTGAVEKEFRTNAGTGTNSSGLAHLGKLGNVPPDALVKYLWAGDLLGNMWRIDLSAADGSALVKIATATDGLGNFQPITVPPVVGPVDGSTAKFLVYFGTGQYFSNDDVPGTGSANTFATQTQTMYGILDDTASTPTTMPTRGGTSCPSGGGTADLVCQSSSLSGANYTATTNAVNLATKRGFYLDLPIANGRVNTQAALTVRGTLVFVVNKPSNIVCNPGGSSFFFQLDGTTGGAVVKVLGGNTYFDAGMALADALSSRPVLITTASGTRAIFRLSDKRTESMEVKEPKNLSSSFKRVYKRQLN